MFEKITVRGFWCKVDSSDCLLRHTMIKSCWKSYKLRQLKNVSFFIITNVCLSISKHPLPIPKLWDGWGTVIIRFVTEGKAGTKWTLVISAAHHIPGVASFSRTTGENERDQPVWRNSSANELLLDSRMVLKLHFAPTIGILKQLVSRFFLVTIGLIWTITRVAIPQQRDEKSPIFLRNTKVVGKKENSPKFRSKSNCFWQQSKKGEKTD